MSSNSSCSNANSWSSKSISSSRCRSACRNRSTALPCSSACGANAVDDDVTRERVVVGGKFVPDALLLLPTRADRLSAATNGHHFRIDPSPHNHSVVTLHTAYTRFTVRTRMQGWHTDTQYAQVLHGQSGSAVRFRPPQKLPASSAATLAGGPQVPSLRP
jgi:hypothetical protein